MDASLLRRLHVAASLLTAEFRDAENGSPNTRDALLRKKIIHELGYGEGLAPDGLSDAYITLAAARNAKARRLEAATQDGVPPGPLTRILADMIQEEVATALMLERRLLHLAGA